MLGIYLFSLTGIAKKLFDLDKNKFLLFTFVVILVVTHSPLWHGLDDVLYFGVAGQDMGFARFLPNAFSAILLLSIYFYLENKYTLSVLCIGVVGIVFSGYMIGAAAVTLGIMWNEVFNHRQYKRALLIGAGALVMVLPIVILNVRANAGATSTQIAEAVHILADIRIPQHTQVTMWWNIQAFIKLLIALAALVLVRKTELFPLFWISLGIAVVPSILLAFFPVNSIAIFHPWRVSVWLVPLGAIVLLGFGISKIQRWVDKFHVETQVLGGVMMTGLLLAVVVWGLDAQMEKIAYYEERAARPMMDFAAVTSVAGDVYLVPPRDGAIIDMRVYAGVPIFINWNSSPWNALDVLEWYERVLTADSFYEAEDDLACDLLTEMVSEYPLTHVVRSVVSPLSCEFTQKIYKDKVYLIYEIE